jgi:hypothetical protein
MSVQFVNFWHPAGVQGFCDAAFRGCAKTRPPATLCAPFGIKTRTNRRLRLPRILDRTEATHARTKELHAGSNASMPTLPS